MKRNQKPKKPRLRDYVVPDDIKEMVPVVIPHRIVIRGADHHSARSEILRDILDRIPVPA